jgi:hypothetical protein
MVREFFGEFGNFLVYSPRTSRLSPEREGTNAPMCAGAADDLHRFLVVCALVSDLYCPGYNPRQSLAKDSNLARTAARYRIESAKIARAVRTELLNKWDAHKQKVETRKNQGKASTPSREAKLEKNWPVEGSASTHTRKAAPSVQPCFFLYASEISEANILFAGSQGTSINYHMNRRRDILSNLSCAIGTILWMLETAGILTWSTQF